VVENSGVVVDVAVVDVVGHLLLMDQGLAMKTPPLPQHKGAKREQPAERSQRLLRVAVADGPANAEIETNHSEQHRQRRGELEQDRNAADERRHAERK